MTGAIKCALVNNVQVNKGRWRTNEGEGRRLYLFFMSVPTPDRAFAPGDKAAAQPLLHKPIPVTGGTCPLLTLCQEKDTSSLFILNCYFKIGNKGHEVNREQMKSKLLFPRLQGSNLVWFTLLPGSNSTWILHDMIASIFIRKSALLLLLNCDTANHSPPRSITSDFPPTAYLCGKRDATGAVKWFLLM